MAVEREDYDMAKALKQDIDKLRAAGEAAATGQIAEVPKSRRATDPEEIFNRVLGRYVTVAVSVRVCVCVCTCAKQLLTIMHDICQQVSFQKCLVYENLSCPIKHVSSHDLFVSSTF